MQRRIITTIALTAGTALATLAVAGGAKDDTVTGRIAFEKRCTGCHALDHEKTGPRLAGVVGRKAGAVAAFPYSDAVKKSGVVWNEANLDKWLNDPDTLIPDNDMEFRLDNRAERAAIIAFLKLTSN
jgi:cytochrome c